MDFNFSLVLIFLFTRHCEPPLFPFGGEAISNHHWDCFGQRAKAPSQ
jgi:hypothetical protein